MFFRPTIIIVFDNFTQILKQIINEREKNSDFSSTFSFII